MKAVIEITGGEFKGRKLALQAPVRMTIGRTAMADYVVPHDLQMSGVHFELELEPGGAVLRDRGSTNGTFVNENRMAYSPLQDGDQIRAGTTVFLLRFEEPPIEKLTPATKTGTVESSSWNPHKAASAMKASQPRPARGDEPSPQAVGEQPTAYQYSPPQESEEERTGKPRGVIVSTRPFQAGFDDESPAVVAAAVNAAVWTRQPWLLDYCREQCREVRVERIVFYDMLATLGEPHDVQLIHMLALAESLGWQRMRLVGKYGHPGLLPLLLQHFGHADQRTAVEAGKAFARIVGGDFESEQRVTLPPADGSEPDEFEAEFLDEEKLPDAARAKHYLKQHSETLNKSPRWSRGIDLGKPISRELFMELDLESRWEAAVRGVYRGELKLSPAHLLKLRPLGSLNSR
ncbi:MAG: FHA domain-containing protein [Pirellulaceae bacterium]